MLGYCKQQKQREEKLGISGGERVGSKLVQSMGSLDSHDRDVARVKLKALEDSYDDHD